MFLVCPRLMFTPAWVGTGSNACQTRRNACSIMILPAWGRWQRDQETSGRRKECTSTHWIHSDTTPGYREDIKQHRGGEMDSIYFDETLWFHCFSRCLGDPWQSQEVAETFAHRLPVSVQMSLVKKENSSHLNWCTELFAMRRAWGGRGCHFLAIHCQFVTPFCSCQQTEKGGQELGGSCGLEMHNPRLRAGPVSRNCVREHFPATALNLKKGVHSPHHFNYHLRMLKQPTNLITQKF